MGTGRYFVVLAVIPDSPPRAPSPSLPPRGEGGTVRGITQKAARQFRTPCFLPASDFRLSSSVLLLIGDWSRHLPLAPPHTTKARWGTQLPCRPRPQTLWPNTRHACLTPNPKSTRKVLPKDTTSYTYTSPPRPPYISTIQCPDRWVPCDHTPAPTTQTTKKFKLSLELSPDVKEYDTADERQRKY